MKSLPDPIFTSNLSKISWEKIYEREYGVQYSEVAVSLLAFAKHHFPIVSTSQIVIPGKGNNTAFYIDSASWIKLVEGLNKKYTVHVKNLEAYEKQFMSDGHAYVQDSKKIAKSNLQKVSDAKLLSLFLDHNKKRYQYSAFAWSAFILNNYVADRATNILDTYIQKHNLANKKQDIYDALFTPPKKAAILQLQYEVERHHGKLTKEKQQDLFNRFKWLSCLDIHNAAWTPEEFAKHIEPFAKGSPKKITPFITYIKKLEFSKKDLEYLLMAKRFVYIKDARDDFRRESVFYARNLFGEIARRMQISAEDTSYLQEKDIVDFLSHKNAIDSQVVAQRKKGFCVYIDKKKQLVCVSGENIKSLLSLCKLQPQEEKQLTVTGRVACAGKARGVVTVVHGIKDIAKVHVGNVLVAVTTHPDYVPAMRKAVAIVTDEGGITSHAAIVSREFGIPCIVGCRNATQLLHDGDMVEVDTEKAKVVKIS